LHVLYIQLLNDDQWAVAVHLPARTCVKFKHVLLKPDQARPGGHSSEELVPRSRVMEVGRPGTAAATALSDDWAINRWGGWLQ
jgi:hypothetical protein